MCTSDYKCVQMIMMDIIFRCVKENSKMRMRKPIPVLHDNQNNILMQTTVGEVACVGSNNYHTVRLMFDSGSQRTYVTQRL